MNEGDLENPKIELQGKLNLIYERIDVGGSALEKKKIVFSVLGVNSQYAG